MTRIQSRATALAASVAGLALVLGPAGAVAPAHGQEAPLDIEVPVEVLDRAGATAGEGGTADDSDLDLANLVQSAAKGVTTVQEAPAIVTVVTADEIKERQYRSLDQVVDGVPGWQRASLYHNNFSAPLVRGQGQAVQYLHDSLSLFDPDINVASTGRLMPMELIKRVEFITGPGGVLWGSNSLLGILNVITKDADDVDGVEAGGTLGGGPGDRGVARAYAMVGLPDLAGGKVKLLAHGSFETFQGMGQQLPQLLFHQPLPQPNAPNIYGPLITSDQPRSTFFTLSGKLSIGNLQLRVFSPFIERMQPAGLSGNPVREDLPQDDLLGMDGQPLCPNTEPYTDPMQCVDKGRRSRASRIDFFDRYAVAEYRGRFARGKAGVTIKGYGIQFNRKFSPLQILTATATNQGGLSFVAEPVAYRLGGAVDGDVELDRKLRVLYGAEVFTEWLGDNTTRSLQGEGAELTFPSPYNLSRLPLLCPRELVAGVSTIIPGCPLTFVFDASRTVTGAYLNPQWRPSKKLILDLGARAQIAPAALGSLAYDLTTTLGGTVVWNFLPSWYAKFNLAQGFRPPVFNNTNSNGESVQVAGNPDLEVETSDAAQAEVNARLFKGSRRLREVAFRADYSYTRMQNLIQVQSGRYLNTADRAMHSGELLAKVYVQGGHRLELGYTYLRAESADKGRLRSLPEHWFNLGGIFNLIDDKLSATTGLRVTGAAEDPNRLVEYRDLAFDEMGNIINVSTGLVTPRTVNASEVVLDRLPPIAELTLGVAWQPMTKLRVEGTVLNTLGGRYYQPDVFFDYEPHLELLPNAYEDLRAYVSATYQY